MPTYRVILAVLFSSFLALATVSCDRDKNTTTTGEKKVDKTTQQPAQPGVTPPPAQTQPGQKTGEAPPPEPGTGQKTQ